jgi:threonyl-tRNA synthetase
MISAAVKTVLNRLASKRHARDRLEGGAGRTVAVRARDGDVKYGVKLDDFIAEVKEKIRTYA